MDKSTKKHATCKYRKIIILNGKLVSELLLLGVYLFNFVMLEFFILVHFDSKAASPLHEVPGVGIARGSICYREINGSPVETRRVSNHRGIGHLRHISLAPCNPARYESVGNSH